MAEIGHGTTMSFHWSPINVMYIY